MQSDHLKSDEGSAGRPPRTWLVLGDKLGDNAQIRAIADRLPWTCEERRLSFREPYKLGKPPFRASLFHVDAALSDPLEPPWPDLILTVGRRPAMAALWIRERSGGRTKIVLLGRPKKWMERFALVVAPPQYRIPPGPRVLRLEMPLMRVNAERLSAAAAAWKERLVPLPRPLTAVLVGGETKPFVFDATVAADLARRLLALRETSGGSLFVTTSRRTSPQVREALRDLLKEEARLYEWGSSGDDNPYLGLLAHADRFVVTGDSISMMVEVAGLGRPLAIFPLPRRVGAVGWMQEHASRLLHGSPLLHPLGRLLFRFGLAGYSRDLREIHRILIEKGVASLLGDPFPTGGVPLPDEVPGVVERICGVVEMKPEQGLLSEGSGAYNPADTRRST